MTNARNIVQDVFPNMPIDDVVVGRLFEVIKTLNEREQCVIEKRISGMTLGQTGSLIRNLGTNRNPCDGISSTRTADIYRIAIRRLQTYSRKSVWSAEMTADQWLKRYTK